MSEFKLSRRSVITAVATLPVLVISSISAAESDEESCVDQKKLRAGDKSLRESMQYTSKSADSEQACASCAFFQPADDDSPCGNCVILNGTVDATGHCVSFSPKG